MSDFKSHQIVNSVRETGYAILHGLFDPSYVEHVHNSVDPLFDYKGRNEFEGYETQRVYSLVSQTRATDRFLEHPQLLDVVEALLGDRPLLMRSQGIRVLPGSAAQDLHRDDVCIPVSHPGQTLSVSLMLALSDFDEENGGTRFIPYSHLADANVDSDSKIGDSVAEMRAGSVLIMVSELMHGAGENRTLHARTGIFANYCVPWLRTLDNHYIPFSKIGLNGLSDRMLELLGYDTATEGGIVYGVVEGRHPMKFLKPTSHDNMGAI
jgi:ectoine hydroxylase-related dioxygenase (phytanoyl-CoA dioxygenase family)